MTDAKRRIRLGFAEPGERFDVQVSGDRTHITMTRLEPAQSPPAKVRFEKRGGYTVGVSDQPITEEALKEALAEWP